MSNHLSPPDTGDIVSSIYRAKRVRSIGPMRSTRKSRLPDVLSFEMSQIDQNSIPSKSSAAQTGICRFVLFIAVILAHSALLVFCTQAFAEDNAYMHCEFSGETVTLKAVGAWSDKVDFKLELDARRAFVGWNGKVFPSRKFEISNSTVAIEATETDGWEWRFEVPDFDIRDDFAGVVGFYATADAVKNNGTESAVGRHGYGTCNLVRPCKIGRRPTSCIAQEPLPLPRK
jgi:hypothetical protein